MDDQIDLLLLSHCCTCSDGRLPGGEELTVGGNRGEICRSQLVEIMLIDGSQWAVEIDDPSRTRVTYPSRGAAIAAGVHLAMGHDATLMIHGVGDEKSEIDFSDCDAQLVS